MKTIKQAEHLRDSIASQLETMPDDNGFGESNLPEKRKMKDYVAALGDFITGSKAKDHDVESWINGHDDAGLADYL